MISKVISLGEVTNSLSPTGNFNTISRAQAWDACYTELGKAISEIENGELLITVGFPFSGKTQAVTQNPQLQNRYDVIFDAGLNSKDSRSCVLNMTKGLGWEVDCLFVDTPFKICRKRNTKKMPFHAFQSLCRVLHRPKEHEGFRKLIVVSGV